MAFDFPLHSVLKVRSLAEEREERLLQRILQEIAATRLAVEDTELRIAETNLARGTQQAAAATDLQARYAEVEQLRQQRAELQSHLAKLEQLRDAQMAKYSQARRDREMLSEMREEQRTAYDQQQARQEQSSLDDTFRALARRRR